MMRERHEIGIALRRRRASVYDAGALQPHDHVGWFGNGADELHSVAATAFADGARRGEKLMFVAEDPDPGCLSCVDGLERLLATRQLELFTVKAVYGTGSTFSASAQLATFEGVLSDALDNGYRGIRVVADNTSLVRGDDESFHHWLAWEQLTDRFQAASPVTRICFFDPSAVSGERRADLATLHPVRSVSIDEPSFSLYSDGDGVSVTGVLGASSAAQFRRLLGTLPGERPLVVDVSGAKLVDHHALLALAEFGSADRPLRVRGDGNLRELVSRSGLATPHVQFEHDGAAPPRCTRCGEVIGVYEPAVAVLDGVPNVTSRAADPAAVDETSERFHRACYLDL